MENFKEKLIKLLKDFDEEEILEFEEKYDKQYLALKELYSKIKDVNLLFKLVLLNAIVSYQLKTTGENYWIKFSEYFSKKKEIKLPEDIVEFIKKYNNRFINSKVKRIKRLWENIANIDLRKYCENYLSFLDFLSKVLNQRKDSKTLVFSVKIFGYLCRIVNRRRKMFPFEIKIPLDSRIKKISKDQKFWEEISEKTKIPPLHLDSLIWVTMGLEDEKINSIEDQKLKTKILNLKILLKEYAKNR